MAYADSNGRTPETRDSAPNSGEPLAMMAVTRAEIDTSAPFESVKEAVDRFGGSAVWKSQLKQLVCPDPHATSRNQHCSEEIDIVEVKKQAAQLQQALILKERETLDVLKDLEQTKKVVDDLKLRLHKATSEVAEVPPVGIEGVNVHTTSKTEDSSVICSHKGSHEIVDTYLEQILIELKQAKENLRRRTIDLTGIRGSIEFLNRKIEEEKGMLQQACEKLTSNAALISSLEDELNQTTDRLQSAKDIKRTCEDPSSILQKIKQKNFEIDESRKLAECAKAEVTKLTLEIERAKTSTKIAELRFLAAKKSEEAANAAKEAALSEIEALMSSDSSNFGAMGIPGVTLTLEEYTTLTNAAQEAEKKSRQKIEAAVLQVNEANKSKLEVLMKVEEATQEVKIYAKALENALMRVEAANQGKLAVEDALRKWRSEHSQKRRNIHNVTKFKTTAHNQRKDSHVIDLNGSTLMSDLPSSGLRPPLSIGQILSMKLSSPGIMDYDVVISEKENEKPKLSLGQMLNKKQGVLSPERHDNNDASAGKHFTAKRKKLGLVGFSLLLAKQNKKNKKKKQSLSSC